MKRKYSTYSRYSENIRTSNNKKNMSINIRYAMPLENILVFTSNVTFLVICTIRVLRVRAGVCACVCMCIVGVRVELSS